MRYHKMQSKLKEQLLKVSPEKLVDTLLILAGEDEVAWSKIERLVSNTNENLIRYKSRLENIKARGGYISWKYVSEFADELEDLLEELKTDEITPEVGFELICEFFEADEAIFEQSDDSGGELGGIYSGTAVDIFSKFATKHLDRKHVIETIVRLQKKDDYGVRDSIIKKASWFLPEPELRELISALEVSGIDGSDKSNKFRFEMLMIAKQLCDAPLYEKISNHGVDPSLQPGRIDVAEVYLISGHPDRAQEILNQVKDQKTISSYEIEKLQKRIYESQGNTKELYDLAYKEFHKHFSKYTLRDLVALAGEDQKDKYVSEAINKICKDNDWKFNNADFMVELNEFDQLDDYVLRLFDYTSSKKRYCSDEVPEYLVKNRKYLSASLIYRAMVLENLQRANSKHYRHGANCLKKLDKLAPKIISWGKYEAHENFVTTLLKTHKQKRSFWSLYQD